ncbi:hypothetical protein ACN28S_30460 [Cystobacter fuscus]
MLITFLAYLNSNPTWRREFMKNPREEMRKHGLSKEQQDAILSRNIGRISEHVGQELKGEFLGYYWFGGEPVIKGLSPTSGHQGTTLRITVSGDYFPEDTYGWLEFTTSNLNIKDSRVVNSLQIDSVLEGLLTIPDDAPLGWWTLRLFDPQTEQTISLPRAFTVEKK